MGAEDVEQKNLLNGADECLQLLGDCGVGA